jgi:hypothetical protein
MGRKTRPSEKELQNLKNTLAPDNPGETVPVTVRVRVNQRQWLDRQPESIGVLVRRALDLLMRS